MRPDQAKTVSLLFSRHNFFTFSPRCSLSIKKGRNKLVFGHTFVRLLRRLGVSNKKSKERILQKVSGRGSIAQWLAYLFMDLAVTGSIPKFYQRKKCRCCLGKSTALLRGSGQWLENVDQTHQELLSGKLAFLKKKV